MIYISIWCLYPFQCLHFSLIDEAFELKGFRVLVWCFYAFLCLHFNLVMLQFTMVDATIYFGVCIHFKPCCINSFVLHLSMSICVEATKDITYLC